MTMNDLKIWIREYVAKYNTQILTAKAVLTNILSPAQHNTPGHQWDVAEYLIEHAHGTVQAETRATELQALAAKVLSFVSIQGMLDQLAEIEAELNQRAEILRDDYITSDHGMFVGAVRRAQLNGTREVLDLDIPILRRTISAYL